MNTTQEIRNNNNFNLIRLVASILVFIHHIYPIYFNSSVPFDPIRFLFGNSMGSFAVYVFFFISGYLILQSYEHNSKWKYILARIIRIMPAFIVILFVSVFIIGALATNLPIATYFSSIDTYKYLANANLFRIIYSIPNVFVSNTLSNHINDSIWTLPFEMFCYIILFVVGLSKVYKNKYITLLLWIVVLLLHQLFANKIDSYTIPIFNINIYYFFDFFMFFFTGMLFYLFREHIIKNIFLFISLWLLLFYFKTTPYFGSMRLLLVGYIIYFIAFFKPFHWYNTYMKHDYSYGFYLYAFPIQQLFFTYYQNHFLNFYLSIFLSFICAFVCAIMSWHFVEKPCLNLKKKWTQ
jgi:peptidoglycan/LPS O-acetylase OafA/YrhL